MKKSYLLTLPVVVLVLAVSTAVVWATVESKKEKSIPLLLEEGELMSIIENNGNYDVSLEQLNKYPWNDFVFVLPPKMPNGTMPSMSSISLYLQDYDNSWPIQSIKKIDEKHVVVTYKLDKNDSIIYSYIVFEKEVKYYETDEIVKESGNYELWICKEYYFVEEGISYADMLNLKAGDDVPEKLAESAQMKVAKAPITIGLDGKGRRDIELLTKDGVIVVSLEYESGDKSKNEIISDDCRIENVLLYLFGTDDEKVTAKYYILKAKTIELPQ